MANDALPEGWQIAAFDDAIDFREGPGIMAIDFREEGVPLIRLSGLDSRVSVLEGCNYLDPAAVAARWSHFRVEPGDVLLSTSATLGRVAVVGAEAAGAIPYTGIIRMRPADRRVDRLFMTWLLRSPHFQSQVEAMGVGSVIRHFGPMHLRQMTVVLPSLPEQRAIAHILGTLGDKIELNRRQNEILETIARALFKSWFVDFDPVWAKAEGRSPVGLDPATAALFPARFEESELGPVPEGWRGSQVRDFADLNPGSWSSRDHPPSVRYVDLTNTKWGRIDDAVSYQWEDAPSRARRVLRPGDTLVGVVRPGNGSYALIAEEGLTGSTGFAVLRPKRRDWAPFVYLAATAADQIASLQHLADGAAYPAVRPDVVADLAVVEPSGDILAAFHGFTDGLLRGMAVNDCESRTLAATRDALLPKLLAGELRVGGPAR